MTENNVLNIGYAFTKKIEISLYLIYNLKKYLGNYFSLLGRMPYGNQ